MRAEQHHQDGREQQREAHPGNPLGYLRLNGNRSDADDYADGGGERVPSAWRKWNTDAAIGWTPDVDSVLVRLLRTGPAPEPETEENDDE